jgi:hypothetical protein
MTDKLKGPDVDSATAAAQQNRRRQSGARSAARSGKGNLEENRERLRVGADHKTPEMKRGKRGTFP